MYKIGNHLINSKVILAPMAGITSEGYRLFMEQFGVDVSYTEMVSDMGLIYGNKETTTYVDFKKSKSLTGVQLFGNSVENLTKSALIALKLNPHIDFFDVNMACPVPKVTKTGAGSSLLKNPKLCGEIVKSIKEATGLPVTAKIRLGWDNKTINFMEVISSLEEAGVSLIAIHARTAKELYTGLPHYELLKDLRKKMDVPLCVSGNIYSLEDAKKALEITKADAVMVARGGIGNPTLIKQINSYYENGDIIESSSLEEQINYCLELARFLIEEKGEEKAMRIYRGIAPRFFNGFPSSKILKNELATKLNTYLSLVEILDKYRDFHSL